MPPRQVHRKRRTGCFKCKERRVRCGEEKPVCHNCKRLGYICHFAQQQPLTTAGPHDISMRGATTGSSSSFGMVVSDLHIKDLELMHQYSSATYCSMTDRIELYYIWQINIPKHAISHTFLMRGLLAIAALHLNDQNPQEAYFELASFHQGKALKEYTAQLSAISEANSQAVFAFSSICASIAFAFLRQTASMGASFITSMSEVFELLIGSKAVVIEGEQWIKTGDLAPLVGRPAAAQTDLTQSEFGRGAQASLDVLYGICEELEPMNQLPYLSAIAELRILFSSAQALGNRPEMQMAIGWPVLVEPSYLALVKERDHLALTILAHYGAALHCIDDVWFAKGLGAHLVKAVVQVVDLRWQPNLSWPISWASVDRRAA